MPNEKYPVQYVTDPNAKKALFHIHIDAQQDLTPATIQQLESIGFIRDDFTQVEGQHGVPVRHMTVKPKDTTEFKKLWLEADSVLVAMNKPRNSENQIAVYMEGEFIPLDADLPAKPKFNKDAFDELFPVIDHPGQALSNPSLYDGIPYTTFESPVIDENGNATGKTEVRLLEVTVKKRPLNPEGEPGIESKGNEYFRKSEVHITIRKEEADPRLLAVLGAMNFTSPEIPKHVRGSDGKLETNLDGGLKVVHDVPCTIQTADNPGLLNQFTDIVLRNYIDRIGGYQTASIKFEPIVAYGLYGGIDPATQMPLVLDRVEGRYDSSVNLVYYRRAIGLDLPPMPEAGQIGMWSSKEAFLAGRFSDSEEIGHMKKEIAKLQRWPESYERQEQPIHPSIGRSSLVQYRVPILQSLDAVR